MAKVTWTTRHNVTWNYAKQCYDALRNNEQVPPIPYYEVIEGEIERRVIGRYLIKPCMIVHDGITLFGD